MRKSMRLGELSFCRIRCTREPQPSHSVTIINSALDPERLTRTVPAVMQCTNDAD